MNNKVTLENYIDPENIPILKRESTYIDPLILSLKNDGLKKSLRITIGTDFECKLVKKNIQNFLELSYEI